jgi:hypothetical protein
VAKGCKLEDSLTDTYKEALTRCNKEIRKTKRSSWRAYCQGIEDVQGNLYRRCLRIDKQLHNSTNVFPGKMLRDAAINIPVK